MNLEMHVQRLQAPGGFVEAVLDQDLSSTAHLPVLYRGRKTAEDQRFDSARAHAD